MQWPVDFRAAVKMHAHGNQLLKQINRRLHEYFTFFLRPWAKACYLVPVLDGDAEVLMECNKPVPVPGFLEVGALHGYVVQ